MAASGADAVSSPEGEANPAAPVEAPPSYRLTIPLLLAAGWGALLAVCVMFLIEDGRESGGLALASRSAGEPGTAEPARPRPRWETAAGPTPAEAGPAALIKTVSASADALPDPAAPAVAAAAAARPDAPPAPQLGYVGLWGPTAYACLARSRRRGYLPATITETGARAGETLCRFRNGRRDGSAWTMSANCSERGRTWTAQVRLIVDGNRLTWTSGNGSSSYVRCGRRG